MTNLKLLTLVLGAALIAGGAALLADQYLTYPGERGPQGEQGVAGQAGPTGPIGLTGSIGPQGATGLQGSTGVTGAQGLQGPAGATGAQGPEGPSGSVSDSQLSSNVALLNRASQTFTGANTINKTSTTAFAIQTDSGATNLLTADTTNLKITLGTASATPVLLVLGTKNTIGDPTCANGAAYHNSATKQIKMCIDGSWTASGVPMVTSLPSNPSDGDEIYYQADATNGVYWHFRYRAASASAYKWEFIGGSELYSEVVTSETTASGTYVALATAGPSITAPLAGDYMVEISFRGLHTTNAGESYMSYDIGAAGAVDADSTNVEHITATVNTYEFAARPSRPKTGLAAGTALVSKYRTNAATAQFDKRSMSVAPIRVGP